MPQAGWCKECGEWIWVDEQGACQHGHGPECVESVHEQDEPVEPELRYFGVGEPPAVAAALQLGRVLPAALLGRGVRLLADPRRVDARLLSPLLVGSLLGTGQEVVATTAVVGVTVIAEVVAGVARLWAGLNANRLVVGARGDASGVHPGVEAPLHRRALCGAPTGMDDLGRGDHGHELARGRAVHRTGLARVRAHLRRGRDAYCCGS